MKSLFHYLDLGQNAKNFMATKKDLINNLAAKLDYLSAEDARIAVDSVLEHIKSELSKKNSLQIRGFGSMSLRRKKHFKQDRYYNTIYFRASKAVQNALKELRN